MKLIRGWRISKGVEILGEEEKVEEEEGGGGSITDAI